MRFTCTGGAAALLPAAALVAALAIPALAQTTGSDTGTTSGSTAGSSAGSSGDSTAGTAAGQDSTGQESTGQAASGQDTATQTGDQSGAQAPGQGAQTGDQGAQPAQAADQPAAAVALEDKGYAMGDVVLGDPDAPLTVVEYASFTCPHCAAFAVHTFPEVKEKYIDTGKVKFVLREVYFDQYGLWASMVARCGGEKGFYPLAETYLTTQSTWTRAPDIGSAIQQIGRRAGLSADRLEQCLSDREFAKQLLSDYQQNVEADEVKATPTFLIGGEKASGEMTFEDFSKLIDARL